MSTPEISRKQAWMKLAVLIADGLPVPQSIGFNPKSDNLISIDYDANEPAFTAWCQALGAQRSSDTPNGAEWLHTAHHWDWNGWTVQMVASSARVDPDPAEGTTEDLTEIRKLAEGS